MMVQVADHKSVLALLVSISFAPSSKVHQSLHLSFSGAVRSSDVQVNSILDRFLIRHRHEDNSHACIIRAVDNRPIFLPPILLGISKNLGSEVRLKPRVFAVESDLMNG